MKKKAISALLCVCMVATMLAGCGGSKSESGAADAKDSEKKLTVGSVIMNTSGEWFAEVIKGMETAAKDLNADISIVSSDNEVSKESDNVATLVAQQVDALCISPLSTDASVAAVESAKDAGIPVINWNTTVDTDTDGFVGVSNYDLGGMTGEYVADFITKNYPDGCKIALLTNSSYEVGVERCNGFKDAIKDIKGLEVVATQDAEAQEEGLDITEQILTANPDVDVIWAWNQTSLLGCVAALQNAKNSDIVVMGTDMSVDLAKDMLSSDVKLQAVTTQMPYDIGYTAVENAIKAAKGEKVEKETLVPLKTYIKDNTDEINTYIEEHKDLVK
ncbi:MAG: substrate-binding domain-containing protein [Lachnospiraceae bacterium]|nr:substrate-binding domain-containing protein [Lachnospiraceae bacterium]